MTLLVNSSTNSGTPSVLAMIAADGFRRQAMRRGDAGDQLGAFRTAEPAERQQRRVRPRLPGRREFRPRRHHGQQPRRADTVREPRHQFEGGGVDPMRVFQDQQHRFGLAEAERSRRQAGRWSPPCAAPASATARAPPRDRQQLRQQRNCGRIRRRACANSAASFVELRAAARRRRRSGPRAPDAGSPDRARCRCDRASIADGCARVRLAGERFLQRLDRARFADPGLADHSDDLPFARGAPDASGRAAAPSRARARSAAGRRCGSRRSGSRPTPRRRRATPAPARETLSTRAGRWLRARTGRRADAASLRLTMIVVGRRERLKPRREIGRLADDAALLRGALRRRSRRRRRGRWRCRSASEAAAVGPRDAADFGDDGERGAHRALGRVLESAAESRNRPARRRP